ncbi:MAG: MBL fold metallo-hydrolase [Deferribacteraceae bacterium]|nr:MBL fold metallo-hydrolase [Deferribacteraceae bacterium]
MFDEAGWRAKVEAADGAMFYAKHVDEDGNFFNPWLAQDNREWSFGRALSYWWSKDDIAKSLVFPAEKYANVENSYDYLSDASNSSISFIGHASLAIKLDGTTILTDPFFSSRAFIVGKELKLAFDYDKLPARPVVLISHSHYDHLDKASVKELAKRGARFIVPLKLGEYIASLGATEVHELDWWNSIELDGILYTLVPAQHWSRRMFQAAGSTLWGGFVIEGSRTIYFAGDTGYFKGYREIAKHFAIDYALLPVGAYIPREMMYYNHQNVNEFFMAVDDLGAKIAIPIHLGIIQLGAEPVLYPLYEVDEYMKAKPEYKDRVRMMRVGEFILMGIEKDVDRYQRRSKKVVQLG